MSAIIRSILNMIFSTYTLVWAVFLSFDILTPKVPKFVVTLRLDCHLYIKVSEMKAWQKLIPLQLLDFYHLLKALNDSNNEDGYEK